MLFRSFLRRAGNISATSFGGVESERGLLYHLYSTVAFNHFMHICLAIGSTTVERDSERKSISTERTFSELSRPSDLYKKCSELCAALVEDLGQQEVRGKTVSIKIKTVKFEVKTRAHSLSHHTAEYQDIFTAARELLRVEIQAVQPQALRLRLMGVKLSNLLHQSQCAAKRQDTITGLFKKMAARSPQKTQTLDSVHHVDPRQMDLPQLPVYFSDGTGDGTGNEDPDTQCQDGPETDDKDFEKKCSGKRSISDLAAVIRKPKPVKGRSRNTRKKIIPKTHPQSVALADLAGTDIGKKTSMAEVNNNTISDGQSNLGSGKGKASGQKGKRKQQTDLDIHSPPAEQSGESSGYESTKQAEPGPSTGQCADKGEHNKNHHGGSGNAPSPDGSAKSDPSAGSSCEDVPSLKVFQCPVCQQEVECKNLNYFNDHVDVCLFRQISSQEKANQENIVTAEEEDHDKDSGEGLAYAARSSERGHTPMKHAIPKFPQLETNNNESSNVVASFESSQQNTKNIPIPSEKVSSHLGERAADWQLSTLTETGSSLAPSEETNPEADQGEMNAGSHPVPDQSVPKLEAEFYACPICNVEKIGCSLEDFNEHVDSCLSRRAIKQILEEQKINDSPTRKRPSPSSSSSTSPSQPPPTKKKRSSCGQMKTIDSFFKA